jgi:hypothetical protein
VAADPEMRAVIGGLLFGEKIGEQGFLRLAIENDGVVVVELESHRDVAAVSFKLRYNATTMGRPVVSLGELPEGSVLTVNNTVEVELTILIDSAEPFGGVAKTISLIEIVLAGGASDGLVELHREASLADAFGNDVPVQLVGWNGYKRTGVGENEPLIWEQ